MSVDVEQQFSLADSIHSPWMKMLLAKPVQNKAAEWEDVQGGIRITVPMNRPGFLFPPFSWIIKLSRERNVVLENIGMCDGKVTIENVVDQFSEKFHLSFHESRILVTDYISKLTKRGVVAIVLPPELDPEKSASEAQLEAKAAGKPARTR